MTDPDTPDFDYLDLVRRASASPDGLAYALRRAYEDVAARLRASGKPVPGWLVAGDEPQPSPTPATRTVSVTVAHYPDDTATDTYQRAADILGDAAIGYETWHGAPPLRDLIHIQEDK